MKCPVCNREMRVRHVKKSIGEWFCDYCGSAWAPQHQIGAAPQSDPSHATSMTAHEPSMSKCGTTHYMGCECHEAKRDAELAALRAELDRQIQNAFTLSLDLNAMRVERDGLQAQVLDYHAVVTRLKERIGEEQMKSGALRATLERIAGILGANWPAEIAREALKGKT